MEGTWIFYISVCGAYLIGSIPFGIVASKLCGAIDPRSTGSGNIGFTNVLRVSGKKAGILTLIGDLGKGLFVGWLASRTLGEEVWILAVTFAVVAGHVFSVFLRFRGGKGVATALGAVMGVDFTLGLLLLGVWLSVVAIFKYSSGGALAAFFLFPGISVAFAYSVSFIIFACTLSSMIIFRHTDNILRLLSGQEGKIGSSSS